MPLDLAPRPLPLLTTQPGTGGAAKVSPDDFLVEELPAYRPCGSGEHLYLFVEKRGLSTSQAAAALARALEVSEREVGYAGQKDRRAITRQWFSVRTPKDAPVLDDPNLRVIEAGRHGNKLKLGHLAGNRFVVTLRGTLPGAAARASAIVAELARRGLPNFYGEQRFGKDGDNAAIGAALLGLGEHPSLQRARHDRFLRRLALSALQSELFNRCLASRLADGLWEEVLDGDVLRKRASGGLFVSTDPAIDRARLVSGELDLTGPMPGHRERPLPEGEPHAREERILVDAGVVRSAFAAARGEAEGARRAYRVAVDQASVREVSPDALELAFALPPGSYATRVLAEVVKGEVSLPSEA